MAVAWQHRRMAAELGVKRILKKHHHHRRGVTAAAICTRHLCAGRSDAVAKCNLGR